MYNSKYVIPGIILFIILATIPFWGNFDSKPYVESKIVLPTKETIDLSVFNTNGKIPEGELVCIESKDNMRANHMQMLDTWRDMVVRENKSVYVASNGIKYDISLQNTCMKCHTDKSKFCDPCHNDNSVTPYCWDCHIVPEGGTK